MILNDKVKTWFNTNDNSEKRFLDPGAAYDVTILCGACSKGDRDVQVGASPVARL